MDNLTAHDPGRFWRRMARVGALLCTVATIVPFPGSPSMLWTALPGVLLHWRDIVTQASTNPHIWVALPFEAFQFPLLSVGPICLLLCRRRARPGPPSLLDAIAASVLLALAALPPYVLGLMALPPNTSENEGVVTLGLAIGSGYLMFCGLHLLAGRPWRRGPLTVFWLGIVPIALTFLGWGCALAFTILIRNWLFLRLAIAGAVGSFLLLLGWLKWWAAVRRAIHSAKESSAAAATDH